MSLFENDYLQCLRDILDYGTKKDDRTGTGTLSLFSQQIYVNLKNGFPLITTKKIHIPSVVHELIWFLSGNTNIKYLQENNVKIWNEWADENGDLGRVYGAQWRGWKGANGETYDQIRDVIQQIKINPNSRRLIVSAWNVAELNQMALPPCHAFFQFYVADGKLSCQLYQRSADMFLGVPFNIASYSLLTHMVAKECDLDVGQFVWTGGDCHIYNNHIDQVKEQLSRKPKKLPVLFLNDVNSIFNYTFNDICFAGYDHYPMIKAPVAI